MQSHLERPRASVIVCVQNRPDELETCLQSLIALHGDDFEIIVVDDASTDETGKRAAQFRDSHTEKKIRLVQNEVSRGLCHARNVGIEAAAGDLIFFTDSDCVVEPDWLSAMIAVLDKPEVSAVAGLVLDPPPRNYAERAFFGGCRIGQNEVQGRALVGCNMGFKRSVLREHRFDEAFTLYCDEDDLARRLQCQGHRIEHVLDAVVYHNHHLDLCGYLRMAWRQGLGSARFWYHSRTFIGRDLVFLAAALVTSLLALLGGWLVLIAPALFCLHLVAHLYNERYWKGKSWANALSVLPLVFLYTFVKLTSVTFAYGSMCVGTKPSTCRLSERKLTSEEP